MKIYHGLATYRDDGAAAVNRRCAMWLPTFLQRGIHFLGEQTEVSVFNNFVLFDRVHLTIIGKSLATIEEGFAVRPAGRRRARIAANQRRLAVRFVLPRFDIFPLG